MDKRRRIVAVVDEYAAVRVMSRISPIRSSLTPPNRSRTPTGLSSALFRK